MMRLAEQNVEEALVRASQYPYADWHWLCYVSDSDLLLLRGHGIPPAYLAFLKPRSMGLTTHFSEPHFSLANTTAIRRRCLPDEADNVIAIRSENREFHVASQRAAFFTEGTSNVISRR